MDTTASDEDVGPLAEGAFDGVADPEPGSAPDEGTAEPAPNLDRIAEHARLCLRVEGAAICLVEDGRLRPIGLAGLDLPPAAAAGTIWERAARRRTPLIAEDIGADRRFADPGLRLAGMRAFLGVSLGRAGAIAALDPTPRGFTARDARLLASVAGLAHDALTRRTHPQDDPDAEAAGVLPADLWRRAAIRRLARPDRGGGGGATVALVELDGFEAMRERLGEARAEAAMRQTLRLCAETLRASDLRGRAGPGRMAALLQETVPGDALRALERLRRRISGSVATAAMAGGPVTLSAGLAWTGGAFGLEAALSRAAEALSVARRAGGDVIAAHEPEAAASPLRRDAVRAASPEAA